MENPMKDSIQTDSLLETWSKEQSIELILFYLENYYLTLEDNYLAEALQVAREDGIDFQKMLSLARTQLN